MPQPFTFRPLTADTWKDFEALVGPRGACGGCWCMTWRLQKAAFEAGKGEPNKKALKKLALAGDTLGVMAYQRNEPAGWCAVAPRYVYTRLAHARVLKPVDDAPVWSISCFFVAKPFRRKGLSVALARAAVVYARQRGALVVEAYPVEAKIAAVSGAFAWTGLVSTFIRAGFHEVARHSPSRPIMRFQCAETKTTF